MNRSLSDDAFDLDPEAPDAPMEERKAAFWMDYFAERGQLDARKVRAIVRDLFPWRDAAAVLPFDTKANR